MFQLDGSRLIAEMLQLGFVINEMAHLISSGLLATQAGSVFGAQPKDFGRLLLGD